MGAVFPRRIYSLDRRQLTEEQLAVVLAMTSRRPEPFDEIARIVTEEKAADFHERWVLGYGHASVAEHAVLHLAVENISRLACDTLEDNRLASYTEKSSRYQVLPPGCYYVPPELEGHPLRSLYEETCDHLFGQYHQAVEQAVEYLQTVVPPYERERDAAYRLRLRRQATDSCRFLLPVATFTNVGVTINARALEHAISKLLSSELLEEQELGRELIEQGRRITPTLVKYADRNEYLVLTRAAQERRASEQGMEVLQALEDADVRLLQWDREAEARVVTAFLYRCAGRPYEMVWQRVQSMALSERAVLLDDALRHLGPHDAPVRELEQVDYLFEFVLDYGASRELRRHRMQSAIAQPLTVGLGYVIPPLLVQAGLEAGFRQAMDRVAEAYSRFRADDGPARRVAPYLVTHAHKRRVLVKANLRQCYHLFQLRTGPQAHFTLREAVGRAMELAKAVHPLLFRYLRLRQG